MAKVPSEHQVGRPISKEEPCKLALSTAMSPHHTLEPQIALKEHGCGGCVCGVTQVVADLSKKQHLAGKGFQDMREQQRYCIFLVEATTSEYEEDDRAFVLHRHCHGVPLLDN